MQINTQNYGSAGVQVKNQETINHALDRAAARVVANTELVDRLCGVGG